MLMRGRGYTNENDNQAMLMRALIGFMLMRGCVYANGGRGHGNEGSVCLMRMRGRGHANENGNKATLMRGHCLIHSNEGRCLC